MQIGELSRRTGVSVRMLRYYEAEGLLAPARRTSGYRDFSAKDQRIVEAIRKLGAAGLKLEFIRRFLPCLNHEEPILHPCPDLLAEMEEQLQTLEAQMHHYEQCRDLLADYYAQMRKNT